MGYSRGKIVVEPFEYVVEIDIVLGLACQGGTYSQYNIVPVAVGMPHKGWPPAWGGGGDRNVLLLS